MHVFAHFAHVSARHSGMPPRSEERECTDRYMTDPSEDERQA